MLSIFDRIPTHMDFVGQKWAEKLFQTFVLFFAVAGLIVGYHYEQFSYTVYSLGAGFLLSCLVTLPPWPVYRRNSLKWRKPIPVPKDDKSSLSTPAATASKAVKKKK